MVGEEVMRAMTAFEVQGELLPFLRIAMRLGCKLGKKAVRKVSCCMFQTSYFILTLIVLTDMQTKRLELACIAVGGASA